MSGLLFRDAEVGGRRVDVRVRDGVITAVGELENDGEESVHCEGAALLPGLHDHHLHLLALAAWQRSVPCGPDLSGLVTAAPDPTGWIRGVDHHESTVGDLDAGRLDAVRRDTPVRVQHRSGALWILNSAAVRATRLAQGGHPGIERDARGEPTGRLWRADAWLRTRLPEGPPDDLRATGISLALLGLTSLTDATPDLDPRSLATLGNAVASGAIPQRLHLLGAPTGHTAPGITVGPRKIVIADSSLPSPEELTGAIEATHAAGRAVAVHCVSYEALVLLLSAFSATGVRSGDRIEHASLVPAALLPELSRRGLHVVTQPGFLRARGDDYLRDEPAPQDLYRCASLNDAGVPLTLSSDAPYGPVDPWAVMAAAVDRRTRSGEVVTAAEALTPAQALATYLTGPDLRPRTVRRGTPADLVLLDAPLDTALSRLPASPVRAVFLRGTRFTAPRRHAARSAG
ncbi:amidohydrolase family protein [Streptomyces sp. NPDC091292]|uniref:amidohydrolase family protein n=1 Tax=Streptomyces sp. NPDC091292 TaxID=3365991 RepID=UPI00380E2069